MMDISEKDIENFHMPQSMPKVSVLMITYNHEAFIAQAIDSVITQKTIFPFELVIGEDISTDNTRLILDEYKNKYPEIINLLPSDKKYGANQNLARTYSACRGEYIATLEGDDYWIDDEKLQLQADLMDNRPDLSGCFHHVKILDMSENTITDFWPKEPHDDVTAKDLLELYHFHTTALFFRKSIFNCDLPEIAYTCKNADYAIYLSLADKSPLGYIDRSMSVYRIHNTGMWTSLSLIDRNIETIKTLKVLDIAFNYKYHMQIISNIFACKSTICLESNKNIKSLFYEVFSLYLTDRKNRKRRNNHVRNMILILRKMMPDFLLKIIIFFKKLFKLKLYSNNQK